MSQERVSGLSKFSQKVNKRLEKKAELLTGDGIGFVSINEESLNESRQSILEGE